MKFLSTPSARRATLGTGAMLASGPISIHALREEGDTAAAAPADDYASISIHALREEGDTSTSPIPLRMPLFLSTPSARRATGSRHERCRWLPEFLSTPSARRATSEVNH